MICERNLPMSTGGGPKINQWAIVDELRVRGHQVSVIYIGISDEDGQISDDDRYGIAALQARGIMVIYVDFKRGTTPSSISEMITQIRPDVLFGLGSWQMAWCAAYDSKVPRVCIVGDPEHLLESYRFQYEHRDRVLTHGEIVDLYTRSMVRKNVYLPTLRDCTATFCTAKHSADWLRKVGIENMEYLPMPVPEPAFPGWRRREEDMPKNDKPRIILTGHVLGIATLSGLYYLVDEILPNMEDIDDYDWHVFGGESIDTLPDLARKFKQYPQIQFRGYVEDIRKEMLQADILLVPTPITVGVRTRIVEAFGLGSCVVAHSNNGLGQPELEDGVNISLSDNGGGIAALIRFLDTAPQKRFEMGHAARATFEEKFCTAKSAGRVADVMESVIR